MATDSKPLIAIGMDGQGWHERYQSYAEQHGLTCRMVDMCRSDWAKQFDGCACVVWRPNLFHPWLEQGREKIWFIESELGMRVFPSWRTFCMYDNKKQQAYFFQHHGIPTPKTFVSYNGGECAAWLNYCEYPFVSKTSDGSASRGVKLIKTKEEAQKELKLAFSESKVSRFLRRHAYHGLRRVDRGDRYVIWQEFMKDNPRDCRLSVVAKKYVFVLYRRNRPGDFRASGSGMEEYEGPIGNDEAKYFVELCRTHGFDTMSFDLLFRGDEFVVSEMSFTNPIGHLDNVPGYYTVDEQGQVDYTLDPPEAQSLYMGYIADCVRQHAEG